ncbi:MAG: helix-turn-helix domain-containing GNAT family N-acetyltransferase [Hyphomicrobiaceae bacterium]|nr:helix-turn-helix domain-containing GNAT family N-acetyltransferase [Hyphomicrobiaceae bacterium]
MNARSANDVDRVRRFNRTVARRIGVLDERFLGRGRPFGESRVLFEIGRNGIEVRELRVRLGLDSGYASRILRALEGERLIETSTASGDARVRFASLTEKGRREWEEIDRRSDGVAKSILAPLDAKRRAELVVAMDRIERLLRASALAIAPEPADSAVARWCLQQYFDLLNERFAGGYDPENAQPADAHEFTAPKGIFLVARAAGEPVGCGALKTAGPELGEIKRVWVAENTRGLGIGQQLLGELEKASRSMGHTRIRLDTNKSLTEAQAMYLKNGYVEVPPFNDDPYPDHWFEKVLG